MTQPPPPPQNVRKIRSNDIGRPPPTKRKPKQDFAPTTESALRAQAAHHEDAEELSAADDPGEVEAMDPVSARRNAAAATYAQALEDKARNPGRDLRHLSTQRDMIDDASLYDLACGRYRGSGHLKLTLQRLKPRPHTWAPVDADLVPEWESVLEHVRTSFVWTGVESSYRWSLRLKGAQVATGAFGFDHDPSQLADYNAFCAAERQRGAAAAAAPAPAQPPGWGQAPAWQATPAGPQPVWNGALGRWELMMVGVPPAAPAPAPLQPLPPNPTNEQLVSYLIAQNQQLTATLSSFQTELQTLKAQPPVAAKPDPPPNGYWAYNHQARTQEWISLPLGVPRPPPPPPEPTPGVVGPAAPSHFIDAIERLASDTQKVEAVAGKLGLVKQDAVAALKKEGEEAAKEPNPDVAMLGDIAVPRDENGRPVTDLSVATVLMNLSAFGPMLTAAWKELKEPVQEALDIRRAEVDASKQTLAERSALNDQNERALQIRRQQLQLQREEFELQQRRHAAAAAAGERPAPRSGFVTTSAAPASVSSRAAPAPEAPPVAPAPRPRPPERRAVALPPAPPPPADPAAGDSSSTPVDGGSFLDDLAPGDSA